MACVRASISGLIHTAGLGGQRQTHILSVLEGILDVAILVTALRRFVLTIPTTVIPVFHPRVVLFFLRLLVLLDDAASRSAGLGVASSATGGGRARSERRAALPHGRTRNMMIGRVRRVPRRRAREMHRAGGQ